MISTHNIPDLLLQCLCPYFKHITHNIMVKAGSTTNNAETVLMIKTLWPGAITMKEIIIIAIA